MVSSSASMSAVQSVEDGAQLALAAVVGDLQRHPLVVLGDPCRARAVDRYVAGSAKRAGRGRRRAA